ncbi:MAG: hypothetical protein IT285_13550 [Bdellovibrionales bacterium]|nr:hypothetical protein [Bdellovibrionales bacterium]
MAQYRDSTGPQHSWIHDLAKAEIHPQAERLLDLGRAHDPQRMVEESTVEFLTALRERFTDYARVFNAYSETGARFQEAKVYAVANTAADFMVFRNQVKLIVSNSAHGVIQFAFNRHVRSAVTVDGQGAAEADPASPGPQEILAQLSPFREVHWTYHGEKVQPEELARFYFTEFTRATRAPARSRASNQLLLEEIKSLLKEKGLDL